MTPEEAISKINELVSDLGYKSLKIAKKMAIEALEKQIPKAPIMKPYYEDMPEEEYLCCPTCGDTLTDRIPYDNKNFYFHCLNCGQAFKWNDDNLEGMEDEED